MADPMNTYLALPSNRPMRLSNPVPNEVWKSILSHLIPERDTLRAVVHAKCAASDEAGRVYWRNDLAVCGLIEELLKQQKDQQQVLANMIRHVTMEFESLDHLDKSEGLQFPSLETLSVYDDVSRPGTGLQAYARIRSLVGASFVQLYVGSQDFWFQSSMASTDNYLPALCTSTNLSSLEICACVDGATPEELNSALKACERHNVVRLDSCVDPLINKDIVETLARHRLIKDLQLSKHINASLAFAIVNAPRPFACLVTLDISAESDAAEYMLPHFEQLETLRLSVRGTNSIFASLGKLTKLRSLSLQFCAYPINDYDVSHLALLGQLQVLELYGSIESQTLDATAVSANLFVAVLRSLPLLHTLKLDALHSLGDPFLVGLGRACRFLRILSLSGLFTIEPFSIEPNVLFPVLVILELGNLSPSNPLHLHEWGDIKQCWADTVAQEIADHAPRLVMIDGCEPELHEVTGMVFKTWSKLKQEKEMRRGDGSSVRWV
jgi:hypothetical protein